MLNKPEIVTKESDYYVIDPTSKDNLHTDFHSNDYTGDVHKDSDEPYNSSPSLHSPKSYDSNIHSDPGNGNENMAGESNSSKLTDLRWIVQLAVVMFAMVFNGTVYGYTSPAFTSLVIKDDSK